MLRCRPRAFQWINVADLDPLDEEFRHSFPSSGTEKPFAVSVWLQHCIKPFDAVASVEIKLKDANCVKNAPPVWFNVGWCGMFCNTCAGSDVNSDVAQHWHSPSPVRSIRIFFISEAKFCNEIIEDSVVFVRGKAVLIQMGFESLQFSFELGISFLDWKRHAMFIR